MQSLSGRIWTGIPEDLLRRTKTSHARTPTGFDFKIFSQGPVQDHGRTAFHQDPDKIFSQGPVQDHARTSFMISAGSPKDLLRRAFVTEDFTRTSTRSSHKDNRFAQACAIDMHMDMSQEPCYARTDRKNAAPQDRDLGQPSCASLRNRNAPERCRTVTLCENVKEKYRASGLGQKAFCARMYSKKMPRPRTRTTVLREPARSKFASHLCQNLQQKMSRSLWARAIEMHLDISQAPVCARICSRTSGAPWSNPGLKIYRKNPSVCTPGMCSNAGDVAGCLQNIGRRQQCNVLLRC